MEVQTKIKQDVLVVVTAMFRFMVGVRSKVTGIGVGPRPVAFLRLPAYYYSSSLLFPSW